MFNFFKKKKDSEKNSFSIVALASLLIHAARIDENYSEKEKGIIKQTLLKLGADNNDINDNYIIPILFLLNIIGFIYQRVCICYLLMR